MTRKSPREHPRKPTIITQGTQAGKLRQGAIVNPGVTHEENKTTRRGPDVHSIATEPEDITPRTPIKNSEFAPPNLRSLPENPLDLFEPLTTSVLCEHDAEHTITISFNENRINVDTHNHDLSDDVVEALGGGTPPCYLLKRKLEQEELYADITTLQTKSYLIGDPDRPPFDGITTSEEDDMWEIFSHATTPGAIRHVASEVASSWISSLDIRSPHPTNRLVYINPTEEEIERREQQEKGEPKSIWSTINNLSSAGKRPVAMFANWGENAKTRMAINLNKDWYEEVRANGYLIQGRLNLGSNNDGQVVADIDPEKGVIYSRVIKSGEVLPPIEKVLAEAKTVKKKIASRSHLFPPVAGSVAVGGTYEWDYNDEFYYHSGGVAPRYTFSSGEEAREWAVFTDVKHTMFDYKINAIEYSESHEDFPEGYDHYSRCDLFDLMNASTKQGVPANAFSTQFVDWSWVTPTEL